jgi:alpha-tubulin suppressor-like RCC1 family protein
MLSNYPTVHSQNQINFEEVVMIIKGGFTKSLLVVLLMALLVMPGCGITGPGGTVPPPTEEDYADDSGKSPDDFSIDTTQNPNYLVVDLLNTAPATDPVGYTCSGRVIIPRRGFDGYDLLHIKVIRETAEDNHVAFMKNSIENLNVLDYVSNGHYIAGWHWLRDVNLAHYAEWTLTGLPPGEGDISLDLTVLATDRMDGNRGFDAHFLLYYQYGRKSDLAQKDDLDTNDLTLEQDLPGDLGKRARISAGTAYSMALMSDGTIWAWGKNSNGQLGDGTTTARSFPTRVVETDGEGALIGVVGISAGNNHSLALLADGAVRAWGYNNTGQLGDGAIESSFVPIQVRGSGGNGNLTGVIGIAPHSGQFSLVLGEDGTAWTWGYNSNGVLGQNHSLIGEFYPVQVKGPRGDNLLTGLKAVSTGTYHAMGLHQDGTVWSWGSNSNGQLGNGNKESKPFPVQVIAPEGVDALKNVVALSAGAYHSLALLEDGTVWAWGDNSHGQLGTSSIPFSYTPVQVGSTEGNFLSDITAISAGYQFSLALKADGTVWAWGQNEFGQLGDNTKTGRSIPAQVLDDDGEGFLSGIIEISAGKSHCLALRIDGSIWSWGNNIHYRLGDGTGTHRKTPVQVKGPAGVGHLNLFDPPGE